MRKEDLILVSVDDHVVEPPDVFEHHLPAKYKDMAPRIEHRADGTDAWKFLDFHIPNVGLNAVAGRPPEEFGMDPTSFDEPRPRSAASTTTGTSTNGAGTRPSGSSRSRSRRSGIRRRSPPKCTASQRRG